jgi:hypothetical protein
MSGFAHYIVQELRVLYTPQLCMHHYNLQVKFVKFNCRSFNMSFICNSKPKKFSTNGLISRTTPTHGYAHVTGHAYPKWERELPRGERSPSSTATIICLILTKGKTIVVASKSEIPPFPVRTCDRRCPSEEQMCRDDDDDSLRTLSLWPVYTLLFHLNMVMNRQWSCSLNKRKTDHDRHGAPISSRYGTVV